MGHRTFNPYCRPCVEAKHQRRHKRKGGLVEQSEVPTVFGEQTTGDHLIIRRKGGNLSQDAGAEVAEFPKAATAAVIFDLGTKWLGCYPQATRTTEDTIKSCQDFAGRDNIKSFYCDNAHELAAAAKRLGWPMPTSTPGVPDTNGLAERYVRTTLSLIHISEPTRPY